MNVLCRKIVFLVLVASIGGFFSQTVPAVALNLRTANEDPIVFVDPLVGTSGQGHTYPGATVPFGMVQLSPDNGRSGIDWYSGYHYRDTIVVGFSHSHLSGTSFGELSDILFMPSVGAVPFTEDIIDFPRRDLRSSFSHEYENATPGYYRVFLNDYGVDVELTATQRCGVHRYTFPQSEQSAVLIDLGFSINSDMAVETRLDIESDSIVSGYRFSTGYANDHRVYFVAKFSKPFSKFALGVGRTLGVGSRSLTGRNVKGVLHYNTSQGEMLVIKVGISSVSREGALKNLEAEVRDWNFNRIRDAAAASWSRELRKIKITSLDHVAKRIFYTALYHTMLAPVIDTDVDGRYYGADAQIHTAQGYTHYSTFAFWDTFRAQHPLLTILHRERVGDMIQSVLAFAREAKKLPSWPLFGNEANGMGGYEAAPIIVDAYLKGIRTFNTDEAFSIMKQRATRYGTDADQYMEQYINSGYVFGDKEIESVSKTLDFSFNDWCIAQLAKALEAVNDYYGYLKRAGNYRNLYDDGTGFMRPKLSDGSWKKPFDPRFSVNRNDDYTAATAYQYTWFVPHDIQGLIVLMGGAEQFIERLDQLFEEDPIITGEDPSPEITGLIGMYAHGTEPSHHIPYLYCYAGAPWKTQARVRQILDSLYLDTPDGLCGNDGCGQLSAWYIFSAIGFYPVNPASGVYIIGSPYFDTVSIETGGGREFTLTAKYLSGTTKYIQSATINGNPLNRLYITHNEILQGAEAVFDMGDAPNITWGVNDVAVPPTDMK